MKPNTLLWMLCPFPQTLFHNFLSAKIFLKLVTFKFITISVDSCIRVIFHLFIFNQVNFPPLEYLIKKIIISELNMVQKIFTVILKIVLKTANLTSFIFSTVLLYFQNKILGLNLIFFDQFLNLYSNNKLSLKILK